MPPTGGYFGVFSCTIWVYYTSSFVCSRFPCLAGGFDVIFKHGGKLYRGKASIKSFQHNTYTVQVRLYWGCGAVNKLAVFGHCLLGCVS